MNIALKLIGLAVLLVAGISYELRQGRTAAEPADCTPKDLDVRPAEKIAPPKPADAEGNEIVKRSGCACGCACEDCQCGNGKLCSLNCICADYATMRARALKEGKPLLVIVGNPGVTYPDYSNRSLPPSQWLAETKMLPPGWLVVCVKEFPGAGDGDLVVGVPCDGDMWMGPHTICSMHNASTDQRRQAGSRTRLECAAAVVKEDVKRMKTKAAQTSFSCTSGSCRSGR